jgi:hypothetical protein
MSSTISKIEISKKSNQNNNATKSQLELSSSRRFKLNISSSDDDDNDDKENNVQRNEFHLNNKNAAVTTTTANFQKQQQPPTLFTSFVTNNQTSRMSNLYVQQQ